VGLYGILLITLGFCLYLIAVVVAAVHALLPGGRLGIWLHALVWHTGVPVFTGLVFCSWEVFVLLPSRPGLGAVPFIELDRKWVTGVLTAYNDEESIPCN
jgi:hypothetical protein